MVFAFHKVILQTLWFIVTMTCLVWKCIRFILSVSRNQLLVMKIVPTDLNQVTTGIIVKAAIWVTVTATMNRWVLRSIWVTPCGAVAQNARPCHVRLNVWIRWGSATIRMWVHYQIGTVLRWICLDKDTLYTALNSIRYNAYCKRWTL